MNQAAEVFKFRAEELRVDPMEISEELTVYLDFGVAGVEGENFLLRFFERFDIDSDGVEALEYFGEERGCNPIIFVVLWIAGRVPREALIPVTVGDLIACANSGE